MKILFVYGDDDYGALSFEDNQQEYKVDLETWNKVWNNDNHQIEYDDDENQFHIEAMEFDSVDPKFIEFITDKFIDYDMSKNTNFYIIKEGE